MHATYMHCMFVTMHVCDMRPCMFCNASILRLVQNQHKISKYACIFFKNARFMHTVLTNKNNPAYYMYNRAVIVFCELFFVSFNQSDHSEYSEISTACYHFDSTAFWCSFAVHYHSLFIMNPLVRQLCRACFKININDSMTNRNQTVTLS